MKTLFSKLFAKRHSHRPSKRRARAYFPSVEALEDRQMMTYGVVEPVAWASPPPYAGVMTPNDTDFGEMWSLNNDGTFGTADADIDAPEAWGWTTGSTKTVIAVVDTGVDYRHPDLYLNIWLNESEIPTRIRQNLIDTDGDGLLTFRDLNAKNGVNQGEGKANDINGNGYIDGGDLLACEWFYFDTMDSPPEEASPEASPEPKCLKPETQSGYSDAPDPIYIGGMSDGRDSDGNGYIDDFVGWNFKANDNNPFDFNGHGTHVAGTIGATGNNSLGVTGINWKTQIMALRIGFGSDAPGQGQAIDAIHYAVAEGARASNHSWGALMNDQDAEWEDAGSDWGLYEGFDDLRRAIDEAAASNHIVVAAAGNDARNIDEWNSYPAGLGNHNTISVAATDEDDQLAAFSNFGFSNVDLGAPGTSIWSTVAAAGAASQNAGYDYKGGTSMAAPHVTGVVGLVWSMHPGWTYEQVIDQILSTVDPLPALHGMVKTGGRLNALKAVAPGPWITTPEFASAGETDRPVSSVAVTFNQSIRPDTFTVEDVTVQRLVSGSWAAVSVTGVQLEADTGNRKFHISFAHQGPGTYRFFIGPDIKSQTGYLMDVDRDGVGGEATDDRHSFTVEMTLEYLRDRLCDTSRFQNFVSTVALGTTQVYMNRIRTTMVNRIIIHYALDMKSINVTNLRNYRLVGPGSDGVLGTSDDQALALGSAAYDSSARTVTLTPQSALAQNKLFSFTVFAGGLVDAQGRQLDGDGDGSAGGSYVMKFARGTSLSFRDQLNNNVALALSGGGAMELFVRPNGEAQQLRLVGAVAQSQLSATVQALKGGTGYTTLGAISANSAFVNKLSSNVRVGPRLDFALVDELFSSKDIVGKFGWTW